MRDQREGTVLDPFSKLPSHLHAQRLQLHRLQNEDDELIFNPLQFSASGRLELDRFLAIFSFCPLALFFTAIVHTLLEPLLVERIHSENLWSAQ